MKIHVRFIGPLMYAAGFSEKEIDVPAASTVESVLASLNVPAERPKIVTRNGQAAEPREILAEGDKLAVSPIYSGG